FSTVVSSRLVSGAGTVPTSTPSLMLAGAVEPVRRRTTTAARSGSVGFIQDRWMPASAACATRPVTGAGGIVSIEAAAVTLTRTGGALAFLPVPYAVSSNVYVSTAFVVFAGSLT